MIKFIKLTMNISNGSIVTHKNIKYQTENNKSFISTDKHLGEYLRNNTAVIISTIIESKRK